MFDMHDRRGALLEDRGSPVELECTAILLHQMQRSFAASLIRSREPSPFGSVWRHGGRSLCASIDHGGVHELRSTCQPCCQNSSRLSVPSACRRDDQELSAILAQARFKASCLKYWRCCPIRCAHALSVQPSTDTGRRVSIHPGFRRARRWESEWKEGNGKRKSCSPRDWTACWGQRGGETEPTAFQCTDAGLPCPDVHAVVKLPYETYRGPHQRCKSRLDGQDCQDGTAK